MKSQSLFGPALLQQLFEGAAIVEVPNVSLKRHKKRPSPVFEIIPGSPRAAREIGQLAEDPKVARFVTLLDGVQIKSVA